MMGKQKIILLRSKVMFCLSAAVAVNVKKEKLLVTPPSHFLQITLIGRLMFSLTRMKFLNETCLCFSFLIFFPLHCIVWTSLQYLQKSVFFFAKRKQSTLYCLVEGTTKSYLHNLKSIFDIK